MNSEIIAQIVLIFSLLGISVFVFRKIPVLLNLPEVLPPERRARGTVALNLKEKVRNFNPFKNFSYEIFLQKLLSKIRILTLKTENKTFNLLQKLKEKTQKKKLENKNYWKEIKKIKDEPG